MAVNSPSNASEAEAPQALATWTNYLKTFLALVLVVMVYVLLTAIQSSTSETSISRMQKLFITRSSIVTEQVTAINLSEVVKAPSKPPVRKPAKSRVRVKKVVEESVEWKPSMLRFAVSSAQDEAFLHYTVVRPDSSCSKNHPSFGINYQQKQQAAKECKFAESRRLGCFVGQSGRTTWYFFMAKLTGLEPGATYIYRIGAVTSKGKGSMGLSSSKGEREFKWQRGVVGGAYLVFADMGPVGIKAAVDAVKSEPINLVVHAGDASYASNSGECYDARYSFMRECAFNCTGSGCHGTRRQADNNLNYWIKFFDIIERFSSAMPWMTTMGNHDNDLTWFYKFRPPVRASFPGVKIDQLAPGLWSELQSLNGAGESAPVLQARANRVMQHPYFYSFDDGLVHFISLGTEDNPINAYEMNEVSDGKYGARYKRRFAEHFGVESPQYKWLEADLKAVDRKKTPWIVLYTHRPIYHTSRHHKTCSKEGDWYGCEVRRLYQNLYEQYKVNLVIAGHAHHYQRTKPMKQGHSVEAGTYGVVYIVCGVGGFRLDPRFPSQSTSWVAYRHARYFGYCKFVPRNSSHLEWIHVAATETGPKPLDRHWLLRPST